MPPPQAPAAEAVSVRMYRGLLGDCFLLSHSLGGVAFHALIDCGVLQCIGKKPKTQAGLARMSQVVADLAARTGKRLDLIVATHEHYDHLSGFIREHASFEGFEIKAVWLAWTEDRNDNEANAIRANGRRALSALKAVVDHPVAAMEDASDRLATITNLLQFYDDDIEPWTPPGVLAAAPRPPYDPATKAPRSCANVIEWLKHKAGEARVRYLEPGQVVRFGLDDRLTAKVLGPPRTAERLLQLNPTAGAAREVYLAQPDEIQALETTLRLQAGAEGAGRPTGHDQPFSPQFRRSPEQQQVGPTAALYFAHGSENRRIDGEWLGSAEALALKIDGDVNNTSLVLAIEIPWKRHVLLFPADAQVGNWLSWHDQTYPKAALPGEAPETAQEILERVVLYKVGHHGSHNATARARGLELMTSPHLVAMIPVVEEVAREQTSRVNLDGWAMPYDELNDRLKEKTRGRIVRGDGATADEAARFTSAGSIFALTYADLGEDPLWVELRIDADPA